ncbi:MAG: hypothetical protein J7M26_06755 [Armatimonadetes bacterium]|nr:hypothetical protein [Armatimonadota bacterium]
MFVSSAVLAAGAVLATTVSAPQSVSSSSAQPQPVPVCYGGYVLLRIRPASWGLSPAQRACIVTQRFVRLVGEGFRAISRGIELPKPRVDRCHGNWVVLTGNVVLVTATSADARANKTSARGLAEVWARRASHALEMALLDVGRLVAGKRVSDEWIRRQLQARMGTLALLSPGPSPRRLAQPKAEAAPRPPARLPVITRLRAMMAGRP